MKKIVTDPPDVNETPEKCCDWIASKVESHEVNPNTGRMWISAIRALLELRRDDEQQTLAFFKENIGEFARRYSLANPSNGSGTGGTYASRARTGVTTYERWLSNPTGFRFEARASSPSMPRKRRESDVKEAAPTPAANDSRAQMMTIPLPGKSPFRFEQHADLTRNDVMRIMWGLMVHCADFDPSGTPPMPPSGTGIVPAA